MNMSLLSCGAYFKTFLILILLCHITECKIRPGNGGGRWRGLGEGEVEKGLLEKGEEGWEGEL